MRAAVVAEGGAIEVAEVADPEPHPGELLVRVSACGLCGSDLKARGAVPPGTVMGHEFGGVVVGAGAGADPVGAYGGRPVAVLPVASCGTCAWCRDGRLAHCASARLLGLGGGAGGFAELVAVPATSCFVLPESVPPSATALVEPFAVGLHCVRAGEIGAGGAVLIVGAGTVGLTTLAWARQAGAARITVVDPRPERRSAAEAWGATDTLEDAGGAEAGRYDVVVECVGRPGLLDRCIAAAAPAGRVVVAGVCAEPDPFWPVLALLKELTVRFACYYTPSEFETVVGAFEQGVVDPAGLVGRTVPLERLDEAFVALADGSVVGKILVTPT